MDDVELRKYLLNGKKEERIIFAATPELKAAVAKLAEEQCTTVSALIVAMLADKIIERQELLGLAK